MIRTKTAGLLCALAAVVGACGGGAPDSPAESDDASGRVDPAELSRLVPGHLEVAVDGDVVFEWADDLDLRIVTIDRDDVSTLRFLSVGVEDLQPLDGEAQFRIAFDLAGSFAGPGTYEIPAVGTTPQTPTAEGEQPDPNEAAARFSKVYLTYSPLGDPTAGREAALAMQVFENAAEPCPLTVGPRGEQGTLTCPEVADGKGNTVSLTMTWEATS